MKDKLWIVGLILLITACMLGFIFGPEELRNKMVVAGIVALVTGLPSVLISVAKEREIRKNDTKADVTFSIDDHERLQPTEASHLSQEIPNNTVRIPTDDLIELKKLYDEGILTEDEYASKKKQLLNL